MSTACNLVKSTISTLQEMRNDETFNRMYAKVLYQCNEYSISLSENEEGDKDTSDAAEQTKNMLAVRRTKPKRSAVVSFHLKDSIVMSTLGLIEDTSATVGLDAPAANESCNNQHFLRRSVFCNDR